MNPRQRMRASNRKAVLWLLENGYDDIWLKAHTKRLDLIYAVGDINDYPGKLDLILCGFHETTIAVQDAYRRCFPGERVPFGYTTSNTKLHKKLGIKVD